MAGRSIAPFVLRVQELEKENEQLRAEIQKYKDSEHGLYKYGGGCRCEVCKKAKSDSSKKYLQNVKARKLAEKDN